MSSPGGQPKISVVILNYNGRDWLARCFESLEAQTFFPQIEVIVADNASPDGSGRIAEAWVKRTPGSKFVRHPKNLYFCDGNNVAAKEATGEFVLFLNPDLWLEPDCLEVLYREVRRVDADAATPLVLDYEDNTFQSAGASGLDWFGLPDRMKQPAQTADVFVACGCSLLVRTELFRRIDGFPSESLMYCEESDVCWKVWVSGGRVVTVASARLHHRGAVAVNPEGKTKIAEARTSETKRYLANRNSIMLLMRNSQHLFLLLLIPHLFLLLLEALAALVLVRRWSYVWNSYLKAVRDAFGMLGSVRMRRRQIRAFRRRGDFWMLRFLRLKPSRWDEVAGLFKRGVPKVDAR